VKRTPYAQDPKTGQSATRKYVEAFLESSSGPVEDGGIYGNTRTRSIYDTVFSTVAEPQELLYVDKPKNPTKTYIGRASKLASHSNPNEYLWCLTADFSNAAKQLDDRSRKALALKFCRDWGDYSIAQHMGLSPATINRIVSKALDQIANILDGIEIE
jgi:hypothetical protein